MEYKGDIGLYLSGEDVRVKTCGVVLKQPRIRDIVQFGENDFFAAVHMVSNPKEIVESLRAGKTELLNIPDFQVFIGVLAADENSPIRIMFNNFTNLCLPDYKVEITKRSINFKVEDDGPVVGQLNPFNHKEFGQTLKELFLPSNSEESDPEYNYDKNNKRAAALAKRIKENREKLRKAEQSQMGAGDNSSIFALYTSVLSIGMNKSINDLYDYTPFQLYDAFTRFLQKMQYDTYQSTMMIPFIDTSKIDKVDDWLHNIYVDKPIVYNSMSRLSISGAA